MILKLTDYMKYYYATHSYKILQTIFPRRRLCRRTKPTSEENSASSSATNLSTAFVVRQDFMPVRSFDAGTSSFNYPGERIPPDLHNLDSALFEDFLKTKYPRPVQTNGVHSKHMKQS